MSGVVKFRDNPGASWATFRLRNDDPVSISVANNGVLIKKSKTGLFGPIVFHEKKIEECIRIAKVIDETTTFYLTPFGLDSPVLKAFSQVALESDSIADFLIRLKQMSDLANSAL